MRYKSNCCQGTRPLASFVLITYNQETFIREAIEGAFSQTYSPLEIVLSDDASTDSTFKIMEEMAEAYNGPHYIKLNRNQNNLGLAEHVNRVFQISTGEILVLSAGDDISMPERVERSVDILEENSELNCISFDSIKFTSSAELREDSHSNLPEPSPTKITIYTLEDLIKDSSLHINGAARAVRRKVFDYFGALASDSPTEDSTYFLRCLLLGKGAQVKQPQIFYRIHGNNLFASDNKYKFDYDAIHAQYLRDINLAVSKDAIQKRKGERVIHSLSGRLVINKIKKGFYETDQKKVFFTRHILFCEFFRVKQKIRYFRKAFLRAEV